MQRGRPAGTKKKKGTTSKGIRDSLVGANPATGHNERLLAYQCVALELKMKDWPIHKICKELQVRFEMVEPMHPSTVCHWFWEWRQRINAKCEGLIEAFVDQEHERLEALVEFYHAIAIKKDLFIVETQEDGSILNKSAFNEQAKAAEIAIKAIGAICKLRGLNVEKGSEEEGKLQSFQAVQISILNSIQEASRNGPVTKVFGSEILELDNEVGEDM